MLAGGLFLAGCSGGPASSSGVAGSATAPGAAARAAPGAALGVPAPSAAAGRAAVNSPGAGTTARLAPAGEIIYTAQLTVRAASAPAAAAELTFGARTVSCAV